jgi:hypothetical protein
MTSKRDYKVEHMRRKQVKTRLHADLENDLVNEFKSYLKDQNTTFNKWLKTKIIDELKKGN